MQRQSNVDLQAALNAAAQLQIALADLSISYWQTVLGQAIDWAETAAQAAERLQSGDVDMSADLRRYAEFGLRSANEYGKFALRANSVLERTIDEWQRPRRGGR